MAMLFTGAKIIVTFHHTKFLQERCLPKKKRKIAHISKGGKTIYNRTSCSVSLFIQL